MPETRADQIRKQKAVMEWKAPSSAKKVFLILEGVPYIRRHVLQAGVPYIRVFLILEEIR